jgi:hypothetical protein
MGSVKYLTASEKQKIIELSQTHIDGRLPTYTEISRQVGRCRATVRRVLEATRGPNPRPRRLTIGEKNRIIKLYQTRNGNRWMSTVQVAKIVDRTPSLIHDVVKSAGIARNHREAATITLPASLRWQIIRLSVEDQWPATKIAGHHQLTVAMVFKVLREADLTNALTNETTLLVALYRQGRSITDITQLTGRSRSKIERLLHKANVMRPREEAARLAMHRIAAARRLARIDIQPLAARWIDGAEVETLADEHNIPPDLLWDALAEALSAIVPSTLSCIRTCPFACTETCARTVEVSAGKAGRLY